MACKPLRECRWQTVPDQVINLGCGSAGIGCYHPHSLSRFIILLFILPSREDGRLKDRSHRMRCGAVQGRVAHTAPHRNASGATLRTTYRRCSNIVYTVQLARSRIIICPIAIAYSMGQIIKSFCVCPCVCVCVSVCGHSHGRISSSIFTKLDTDV